MRLEIDILLLLDDPDRRIASRLYNGADKRKYAPTESGWL